MREGARITRSLGYLWISMGDLLVLYGTESRDVLYKVVEETSRREFHGKD